MLKNIIVYVCVCVYVCMYVCICICVCVYIYIYNIICVYICMCVYIYIYIYIYTHTHTLWYFLMHGIVGLRYCINWVAAEEQCLRYMGYDPLEKLLRDTILFFQTCNILNGWYIISTKIKHTLSEYQIYQQLCVQNILHFPHI
jgi:hypothetical protein